MLKNKDEIIGWLETYNVKHYMLEYNDKYGFVVNCSKGVFLENKKLREIKVKFHKVTGTFNISGNNLKSLKGCPDVIRGDFKCNNNELKSLHYGPKSVLEIYNCSDNNIKSLEFVAENLKMLSANNNQLQSLKYLKSNNNTCIYVLDNPLENISDIMNAEVISFSSLKNLKIHENANIGNLIHTAEKKSEILEIFKDLYIKDYINDNDSYMFCITSECWKKRLDTLNLVKKLNSDLINKHAIKKNKI